MSQTLVDRATPVESLQNSLRPPPDIIDVDSWTEDAARDIRRAFAASIGIPQLLASTRGSSSTTGAASAASNVGSSSTSQDVIVIDEDDSDVEFLSLSRPSTSTTQPVRVRRRHIGAPVSPRRSSVFSPPPPPQDMSIPPVPPIPRQFRATFGPSPPTSAPDTSTIIRPTDQPLPFERRSSIFGLNLFRSRPNPTPSSSAPAGGPSTASASTTPNIPPPQQGHAQSTGHRLSMGLGDTLQSIFHSDWFSSSHQEQPQIRHAVRPTSSLTSLTDLMPAPFVWGGLNVSSDDEDDEDDARRFADSIAGLSDVSARAINRLLNMNPHLGPPLVGSSSSNRSDSRHRARIETTTAPEYRSTFTHPAKPQTGFTFDFSPAPDPIDLTNQAGPSSATVQTGTVLACAKCLDPLKINVVGSEAVFARSRIWALRCGHMLDGKCIEKIMKPNETAMEPITVDDEPVPPVKSTKGKGKAKAEDLFAEDVVASDARIKPTTSKSNSSDIDLVDLSDEEVGSGSRKRSRPADNQPSKVARIDKGKGKAVEPALSSSPMEGAATAGSSIRSRLRSSHTQPSPVSTPTTLHEPTAGSSTPSSLHAPSGPGWTAPVNTTSPLTSPPRGRGRGRRQIARKSVKRIAKAKGKQPVPRIEAMYEWKCPVTGCEHVHLSARVDGVWKMDENKGAIAVYV